MDGALVYESIVFLKTLMAFRSMISPAPFGRMCFVEAVSSKVSKRMLDKSLTNSERIKFLELFKK